MARNPGISFELELLSECPKAWSVPSYPGVSGPEEALHLVPFLDLTTLAGDDTEEAVVELCRRARDPFDGRFIEPPRPAAVCVYPVFVTVARSALEGSTVRVATVAAGFPHGLTSLACRVAEIRDAVEIGADEIDVVIRRSHVLRGNWYALYDEVRAFRQACGDRLLKVILAAGELREQGAVFCAALTALMAGADFVKTSTGKESVNATLPHGFAMAQAIRSYFCRTGYRTGLKPAGGIRTTEQAYEWLALVREALGDEWCTPDYFRIGASALLDDLVSTALSA